MLKHHIKATNMEMTEAIQDYLTKKLQSLEKFVRDDVEALAKIEVGKTTHHHNKGEIFRAEINLSLDDKVFRAVSETADLYSAIDEMREQILAEVTKSKRKTLHLFKRGQQKIKDILRGFRRK